MVLRPSKRFTPEVLLSLPRRSGGVPNADGKLVVYTSSTYDFESHKKTNLVCLLDTTNDHVQVLAKDERLSDFNWIDSEHLVYLQSNDDGTTAVCTSGVGHSAFSAALKDTQQIVGSIEAAAGNLKVRRLSSDNDEFAVVVSALASPDGSLFTPKKAARETRSTGRLYDSLFVRHWDSYRTPERNSLWYAKMSRTSSGHYELTKFSNALIGLQIDCPIEPFGGTDHFDISHDAILLVAKDPSLNPALNTKCNVYLLHVPSWSGQHAPTAVKLRNSGFEGAATNPVFNRDGRQAAFLAMKVPGYESDRNRICLLPDVSVATMSKEPVCIELDHWDRSPQSVAFSLDNQHLLLTAEDNGRSRLFSLPVGTSKGTKHHPEPRTSHGNTAGFVPLRNGRVFVHGSSLVDNSWYAILDLEHTGVEKLQMWIDSHSSHGSKFGLKSSQVSWIWTPANNPAVNKNIHSLVLHPSWYSKNDGKTYPVAYLIHGGPQGAWTDSWSTRWNPAIFAEQGYIVIAPNVTGSTGYGQGLTDAIRENWGGDPYEDIVNVYNWVDEHMPEADHSRAVALGASYGGYMMNWIQGHDLGRKFKALVCHDGNFSLAGTMLATEELYFPFHEMGGLPWSSNDGTEVMGQKKNAHPFSSGKLSNWQKWDPSRFAHEWNTPQLVIHSEKDYRLTISEGLAAFNVLQTRGVPSQFLTFPDENHWVLNPENSLVWHKVVLNWINHYAGLPPCTSQGPSEEAFWGGVKDDAE